MKNANERQDSKVTELKNDRSASGGVAAGKDGYQFSTLGGAAKNRKTNNAESPILSAYTSSPAPC